MNPTYTKRGCQSPSSREPQKHEQKRCVNRSGKPPRKAHLTAGWQGGRGEHPTARCVHQARPPASQPVSPPTALLCLPSAYLPPSLPEGPLQ